jgi:Skp family chaperone for outer membrane proteins
MKILKWFLPAIALIFLFNTNVRAADMRIGYVALLQAMYESTEGKDTLEYLKKEAKKREVEVAEKSDEMIALRTEIKDKESVWNPETLEAKIRVFQMKDEEMRRLVNRHTQEFNKQKQDNEKRIENELRAIVDEVAKEKGYTHIFDITLNVLLVMPEEDDITLDVIKAYDKSKAK